MQYAIVIPPRTYQSMLGMFHTAGNTCFTPVGELGFSLFDMKMVTGLPMNGDVYEEYVSSELNLRTLLASNPIFGKMMCFLLNQYTELVHGKRDK